MKTTPYPTISSRHQRLLLHSKDPSTVEGVATGDPIRAKQHSEDHLEVDLNLDLGLLHQVDKLEFQFQLLEVVQMGSLDLLDLR